MVFLSILVRICTDDLTCLLDQSGKARVHLDLGIRFKNTKPHQNLVTYLPIYTKEGRALVAEVVEKLVGPDELLDFTWSCGDLHQEAVENLQSMPALVLVICLQIRCTWQINCLCSLLLCLEGHRLGCHSSPCGKASRTTKRGNRGHCVRVGVLSVLLLH